MSICIIWRGEKKGRAWLEEKQREWEVGKDRWRQEVQCWWKKEVRAVREADRVRRVKNKEYCAITWSLHPLNSFLCRPNPNSGGIFTGKCLVLPLAHINTEWWWLSKWLYGNYVTEWWGVRWFFVGFCRIFLLQQDWITAENRMQIRRTYLPMSLQFDFCVFCNYSRYV